MAVDHLIMIQSRVLDGEAEAEREVDAEVVAEAAEAALFSGNKPKGIGDDQRKEEDKVDRRHLEEKSRRGLILVPSLSATQSSFFAAFILLFFR